MPTAHKETKHTVAGPDPVPEYRHEAERKAREEAEEASEKAKKEGPPKPQAQIDAELAEKGGDVPEERQGVPTEARRWTAVEREREERADYEKFKAEYAAEWNKRHAAKASK